jgi:hypothetical protein
MGGIIDGKNIQETRLQSISLQKPVIICGNTLFSWFKRSLSCYFSLHWCKPSTPKGKTTENKIMEFDYANNLYKLPVAGRLEL